MGKLSDLTLVDASIPATATFAEAVSTLFGASVPAIAVVTESGAVAGLFGEGDLLRAVFPGYLRELRHTAFLPDDAAVLNELAEKVAPRRVGEFARPVEALTSDDSQTHAAERFMHTGEYALPVVDGGRFIGMLSIAALCHARVDRAT